MGGTYGHLRACAITRGNDERKTKKVPDNLFASHVCVHQEARGELNTLKSHKNTYYCKNKTLFERRYKRQGPSMQFTVARALPRRLIITNYKEVSEFHTYKAICKFPALLILCGLQRLHLTESGSLPRPSPALTSLRLRQLQPLFSGWCQGGHPWLQGHPLPLQAAPAPPRRGLRPGAPQAQGGGGPGQARPDEGERVRLASNLSRLHLGLPGVAWFGKILEHAQPELAPLA